MFEEAFRLAKKNNLVDEMCFVEYTRGRFYIARHQYDSAMIHILNYKDMTSEDEKGEGYRNIINLLGDIYFHARLYDQAYEIYFDMYKQYENNNNWNFYRPYVLMNNLGQIALKQDDLQEADYWFNNSLKLAEKNLLTPYRENTIAYTKIMLARTAIDKNDVEVAEKYLDEVNNVNRENIYEDVIQEYIFAKSQLLLKKGKVDEALDLANTLTPGDSNLFNQYRFVPEIYQFLSDVYYHMGDYESSLLLLKEYQRISDSMRTKDNLAQSMVLLTDRKYEQTQLGLLKSKQRVNILILSVMILLLVLFVVLFLYRKLYKSKLLLVRKSIEKSIINDFAKVEVEASKMNNGSTNGDVELERKLMVRLHEYMGKNKPYLDQKISLDELAKQMSTNRTYLSRAINNQLQTSFPNLINKYRIRESIVLIIEGYAINHTQEALAKESGFANRTVFISAFKKHTGVVPSFFIANIKKV